MDIQEKAEKYAEGKIQEALNNAVVEAYREGYKDGYKDCEEEIPVDLRDNKTEYVDLGLPSGTLWSADYEKNDDKRLYVPYGKAVNNNIPTEEQWDELRNNCEFKFIDGGSRRMHIAKCTGSNGHCIHFFYSSVEVSIDENPNIHCGFWLKEDSCACKNYKKVAMIEEIKINDNDIPIAKKLDSYFMGYQLAIRLVK